MGRKLFIHFRKAAIGTLPWSPCLNERAVHANAAQLVRSQAAILFTTALCCSPALAKPPEQLSALQLVCTSIDNPGDTVSFHIWWSEEFSVQLLCIDAGFIVDLTPCAPNGGYAASATMGIVPIVDIRYLPDFVRNIGNPTVFSRVTSEAVEFRAQKSDAWNIDLPLEYEEAKKEVRMIDIWSFNMDTNTRRATSASEYSTTNYTCK